MIIITTTTTIIIIIILIILIIIVIHTKWPISPYCSISGPVRVCSRASSMRIGAANAVSE